MLLKKNTTRVLVFSLLMSSGVVAQKQAQAVPDFNFYKFDKTSFTNKDLATGKMLFFLFFDCDCDHCQHAMMNLNEQYKEYKNAAIYLISLDDEQKVNRFMRDYAPDLVNQKNVTILQDTKNEFIIKFKPRKYPSMFLYNADKKLLAYEDDPENMSAFTKQMNPPGK